MTCTKEPKLKTSREPIESADKLTVEDETGSTPVTAQFAPLRNTSTKKVPNSTLTDSVGILKDFEQQKNPVVMETGATNSSNESCKTPVAPSSDIRITVEDDDESILPLLFERSSAEVIYTRNELKTDTITDMDEKVPTDAGEPFVAMCFVGHFYRVPFRNWKTKALYKCCTYRQIGQKIIFLVWYLLGVS